MSYKLTKNWHVMQRKDTPVLIGDGYSGPYDRNARLERANGSTAADFIMRHRLGELKKGDPELSCDEGADLQAYCWQYLTDLVPPEMFRFAEFYHQLKKKGIKIPELV
jgi:hypothetical protein